MISTDLVDDPRIMVCRIFFVILRWRRLSRLVFPFEHRRPVERRCDPGADITGLVVAAVEGSRVAAEDILCGRLGKGDGTARRAAGAGKSEEFAGRIDVASCDSPFFHAGGNGEGLDGGSVLGPDLIDVGLKVAREEGSIGHNCIFGVEDAEIPAVGLA